MLQYTLFTHILSFAMDLSMIHDLAREVDAGTCAALKPLADPVAQEFKRRLLASPGRKNAQAFETVMDLDLHFFKLVWHAVASQSKALFCELNLFDDMPDRYIRREEYRSSSEDDLIDIVTSLTKRLFDYAWDLTTGQVRISRIAKALHAQRLLIEKQTIRQQGPIEWTLLVKQVRSRAFSETVPKDLKKMQTSFHVGHALLALCVETCLNRPCGPLEEGLVDHLVPSKVFAEDFSEGPSAQDSLQQDLDFMSTAFSCYAHALAATTRVQSDILQELNEAGKKLPNLKPYFERKEIKSLKDTQTLWRNFWTELSWSWSFLKQVMDAFKKKNVKEVPNVFNQWQAFCMNEGLTGTIQNLIDAKQVPKDSGLKLLKTADIALNVSFAYISFAENFFRKRGLREKFQAMDYLVTLQTCENPEASCTPWPHNGLIWSALPQKWTSLVSCFDSLEGHDLEVSWKQTRNQTRLAICLFKDLAFMWGLWVNPKFWTAPIKVLCDGSLIESSVSQTLPTGSQSKLEEWMQSHEDRSEMKKTFQKTQKIAEQLIVDQLASMIESP